MKGAVLISVFSRQENTKYLSKCLEHLANAEKNVQNLYQKPFCKPRMVLGTLLLIDFGETSHPELCPEGGRYLHKPGNGFCANMNATTQYAMFMGFEYVLSVIPRLPNGSCPRTGPRSIGPPSSCCLLANPEPNSIMKRQSNVEWATVYIAGFDVKTGEEKTDGLFPVIRMNGPPMP